MLCGKAKIDVQGTVAPGSSRLAATARSNGKPKHPHQEMKSTLHRWARSLHGQCAELRGSLEETATQQGFVACSCDPRRLTALSNFHKNLKTPECHSETDLPACCMRKVVNNYNYNYRCNWL